MQDNYTKQEVIDIMSAIYDNFDLKITYEDKILNEGMVKDYDDVDAIATEAFDLFLEAYL